MSKGGKNKDVYEPTRYMVETEREGTNFYSTGVVPSLAMFGK
jgi:hypothetical protein